MTRKLTIVLVAVAVSLGLSGCIPASSTGHAAKPSSRPTASSTPHMQPTPSASADNSDPATWLIDFNGIGPIEIGGKYTAGGASAAGYALHDDPGCPNPNLRQLSLAGAPWLIVNVSPADSDTIETAAVDAGGQTSVISPKTAKGIGVGATAAQVRAAYPDVAARDEYEDGSLLYFPVSGPAGRFIGITVYQGVVQGIAVQPTDEWQSEYCG